MADAVRLLLGGVSINTVDTTSLLRGVSAENQGARTELKADLHMHSTASDGRLSPTELVRSAAGAGLDLIALTDHDTIAGLDEAFAEAQHSGIECVAGVEISTRVLTVEVHLLAYGFSVSDKGLLTFLEQQRTARTRRAEQFLERFVEAGLLPESTQLPDPGEGRSLARPHMARMLVEAGVVETMNEAFERYLVPGCDLFVGKPLPDENEVMDVVHAAGGRVFLAHPGHHTSNQTMNTLIAAGLDGVEIWHPSHDIILEEYYRSLARRHGLLMSGGSDFHAVSDHGESSLGNRWITPDAALLDVLRTH